MRARAEREAVLGASVQERAEPETLGRSMFVGPPPPLPPGGMPPARRRVQKRRPAWTPPTIRDSEPTLPLVPAGEGGQQLAPWKEEPVPWRPDALGMVEVGGNSQEMSVPWRRLQQPGATAGGRKRPRRTVRDVARSWYESMQIQWPPLDTWPSWPAWPQFDWLPGFGGPARDEAGPHEEAEEEQAEQAPVPPYAAEPLGPSRFEPPAEPLARPRFEPPAEPLARPRFEPLAEPRQATFQKDEEEEEWRPLPEQAEIFGEPDARSRTEVPRTGRVSSRRYAAMQAGGLFGLIDEGSDGGGARMLLAHVPRKSGHAFVDVRPGERIQVMHPKNGRGVWPLQVAYTGRHRYYSPGARVTTLRVAVAHDDWLRYLQASAARA